MLMSAVKDETPDLYVSEKGEVKKEESNANSICKHPGYADVRREFLEVIQFVHKGQEFLHHEHSNRVHSW